jgi:ribulose-phosphate 3-epimerase
VKQIRDKGMKAGIAISPDTPSTVITDEVGNAVDMLLVMTVHPGEPEARQGEWLRLIRCLGRGGQKFIEKCVPKVSELRARFPNQNIEVDGGVGPSTIETCANAGKILYLLLHIYLNRIQGAT